MEFVPERLRDIRIMKGYTVEELAERLEVSKQAVSKYEMGKTIPSTDVLARLLNLFFIPRGYLTKPDVLLENRSAVFYRRCRHTPKKEIDAAQIYLKWCYEMTATVGEFFPSNRLDLPEIKDGMTVEDMAEVVRRRWGIGNGPVRNLESLLEEHGFYIFTAQLTNEKIDAYSQLIGDIPIIIINRNKGNRMRQQFSIAHELGHILLHGKMEYVDEDTLEELEREADQFAGCFLMPEKEIKAELIRVDADYIVNLGEKWCVSPQAIVERCRRISAFSIDSDTNEAYASALFQRLNRRKPLGLEEPLDRCSIRDKLLAIDSSVQTRQDFLQKLLFPAEEVRRLCSLPNGAFDYCERELMERPDEMEGVQLSFAF